MPRRSGVPWGRVASALGAITASYVGVRTGRAQRFDEAISSAVHRPRGRAVDVLVAAATDLGSVFGLTGTAAALFASGRRDASIDVIGSGALAWVAAQAAKPLLERPRPFLSGIDRLVSTPAGSSWPSGHAAVAASTATAIIDHGRPGTVAASALLVSFVAASRVYVGVHHPTDPVAGAGIGVLSATLWQGARHRVVPVPVS